MNKTMEKIMQGNYKAPMTTCPKCSESIPTFEIVDHIEAHRTQPCSCCRKMIKWSEGHDVCIGTVCSTCLNKPTPPKNNIENFKLTL